jgi:enoyl-CoA hydratase/carnithine racemase
MSSVLAEADGRVGRITLNRPEAMNAITLELAAALEQALTDLGPRIDVIVIRGAAGNFSVGGDFKALEALRAEGPQALAALFSVFGRACTLVGELDVPVVAVVEGYAMAGGFELMQACDIALVAEDAKLADNHSNFGQVPGGGGSQRLPRLVGRQRAGAHILSGDRLSGRQAAEWGLAYRALPAEQLDDAVEALTEKLSRKSRAAQATTKRLIRDGLELPLAEGLALEHEAVVAHLSSEAGAAGIASFSNRGVA